MDISIKCDSLKAIYSVKNGMLRCAAPYEFTISLMPMIKVCIKEVGNRIITFTCEEEIEAKKLYSLLQRILGSAFEITSDTMQLENVYRLSHLEAESLFEKIKYKIEQEDLTYFYSQKAVITLFDVMQKNGLATMYITKLLEIARKLMRCDGLQEPEQFDEEYWAYLDYDNSFSCDILTRKFVNTINLYNKKNFVISEMEMQSYDEQLLEYEKLIKSREKIDKDRYMIIINSIFYMFIDEYKDIEKLWKILLRISRGPGEDVAKDVLKELIENSDDELEIIRYNYLLQEIQMNEYFDMQAEEFEKSYEYE